MKKNYKSYKGIISLSRAMLETCPFSLDLAMLADVDIQAMLDLTEYELEKLGIKSTRKSMDELIMCKLLTEQYNLQLSALAYENNLSSQIA